MKFVGKKKQTKTNKKKTVSNVTEKLMEQGIHCLPCSSTNECHTSITTATVTSH